MDGIINFIKGELLDLRNMTPEEIAEHDAEIERRERQRQRKKKSNAIKKAAFRSAILKNRWPHTK